MFFQQILKENCGWQKLKTLLHNVTVQLAGHLDVLYSVEFSFRSKGSHWRSICVFGDQYVYSSKFDTVFWEVHIVQVGNLSNIL